MAPAALPSLSTYGSNYWVDVVFNTSVIESTAPANGATGISVIMPNITATLNPTVQSSTLAAVLTGANSSVVSAYVSYNSSSNVATITPSTSLLASMYYTVTLTGTFDSAGNSVSGSYSWSFTTTSQANESLWATSTPTNPTRNDSRSVNLGVQFSSDVAGYITGIRFYKGPSTPAPTSAISGPAPARSWPRRPSPTRPPAAGSRSISVLRSRSRPTRTTSPRTSAQTATTPTTPRTSTIAA